MKFFKNREIDSVYARIQETLNFGDRLKIVYYTSGEHLGKYALLRNDECNDELLLEGSITVVSSPKSK